MNVSLLLIRQVNFPLALHLDNIPLVEKSFIVHNNIIRI